MKPRTVFGLREQGAMLLAVERLAKLPPPPIGKRWRSAYLDVLRGSVGGPR